MDEANLTGEADDVMKDPATSPCVYAGCKVLEGYGQVLVTAVGKNT